MSKNKTADKGTHHLEGVAEIAFGVGIMIAPYIVATAAAVGCIGLTVQKYLDEPKTNEAGEKRTWWERLKSAASSAASVAFGGIVGTLTMAGGVSVALVGLGAAFSGNAASFDLVQGAIVGMAAQVAVPAISLILISEGTYKAVTGKPCNVMGYTYKKCKSVFNSISAFCRMTQKPTRENVQAATTQVAHDVEAGVRDVKEETKKRDPSLYSTITKGVSSAAKSAAHSVASTLTGVVGGASNAKTVEKQNTPGSGRNEKGKERK